MTRAFMAGVLYFTLTFGAGFVLGVIRTLWVTPRVGTRAAELTETPIMLLVIIAGASCLTRRLAVPPIWSVRLSMGCCCARISCGGGVCPCGLDARNVDSGVLCEPRCGSRHCLLHHAGGVRRHASSRHQELRQQ